METAFKAYIGIGKEDFQIFLLCRSRKEPVIPKALKKGG